MAFAFDRNGFTVMSGIRATAGERNVDIETRTTSNVAMNPIKGRGFETVMSTVAFLTASAKTSEVMSAC